MLSILAQDENAVRFCCDAEGWELLLSRMQEVAAGDHAWFVGEELSGGEWDWVSVECRGVSEWQVEMAGRGGQRALSTPAHGRRARARAPPFPAHTDEDRKNL